MQIKKRAALLIFGIFSLLTVIPNVFALFEYLYTGGMIDPLVLYQQWQGWFDFTLITAFMIILFSIFLPIALRIQEDEEKKHAMQKLAVILGLIAGLGVAYFGRQYFQGEGLILGLGPLWIFLFMFLFVFLIYRTAKGEGEGKLGIGVTIFLLFATLLLAGIAFPGIYGPIGRLLFGNILIGTIIMLLSIVGFIALLLWILGLLGGPFRWIRERWSGNGRGRGGSGGGNGRERPEEVQPEVIKKPKIRDVKIETLPPGPYEPGKEIVLRAIVTEVGGIFRSRSAQGEFVCTWRINNLVLDDHNQQVIWRVPQALINVPEQKLRIQVEVIDTEDTRRKGRGSTIIKVRGGIPEIIIEEPVNSSRGQNSKEVLEGEALKFRYIFDPRRPQPQNVVNASWFFIQGHFAEVDKNTLKKTVPIAEGNDFTAIVGNDPLNLQPEVPYTIICAAVDKKGKPYILPIINKLLEAHFTLLVKHEKKPTTPPPPGKQPKFIVEVNKVPDKLMIKKLPPILRTETNASFNANLKERYNFTPMVENGNIDDYEIAMTINSNDFFEAIKKGPAYLLELQTTGTQSVICVFQKKGTSPNIPGNVKAIKITINVGKPGTPPPPPGTQEPELKIIKVNNVSARTGMTVPLALNEEAVFEVDYKDPRKEIDEFFWYIEENGNRIPLTKSKDKTIKIKFSREKYIPKEYKIFAVAGNKGNILNDSKGNPVDDYINVRFIAFIIDAAFKNDIDKIKALVGNQLSILTGLGGELNQKIPTVQMLLNEFIDLESELQQHLKATQAKASDFEKIGKINEFMAKAVKDWTLRVAQLTKEGKSRMVSPIEFINKYVAEGKIKDARNVLNGGLLGNPDPKMKFAGGYFTRRLIAVNEVN